MDPERFECLSAAEVKEVQRALKITKAQVVLAYECLKLLQAPPSSSSPLQVRPGPCLSSVHREEREREGGREEGRKGGKEEGRHRCFRLMVKRRLAREIGGDFEGKKEELRAYLDEKFRERVEELEAVCRKAGVWEGGREGAAGGE